MTAYARHEIRSQHGDIIWELRSLNSRYLEIHLKLNDEWRFMETEVRTLINQYLQRGKIECHFRFKQSTELSNEIVLNQGLCDNLKQTAGKISHSDQNIAPLNVIDVLRWPGVVMETEHDVSVVVPDFQACLQETLTELVETREREGEKIKHMIKDRCQQMSVLVEQARGFVPQIKESLEKRLRQRLAEVEIEVEPHRFEQELVFHLQRLDVEEEIDRLQAHVAEVLQVLDRTDAVGRRLDFLMQELNREANTLGSKVTSLDIKSISVEIKVLIEQMREQIQNVE